MLDGLRVAAVTEPLDAAFPVPAYPPASWYTERPDWLTPDTKIEVDDDGRVAGYFYHAGQCLVHNAAACPKPSPTMYAAFHQQQVAVDDGTVLEVGVIGNVNGHAGEWDPLSVAMAHYADPDRQLISCRAYDDEHGGFILGAMVPTATYGDVALVRRSALSGDWRPMPPEWWRGHGITASVVRACEGYDCIGPTLVTRPGLPLVRRFAAAILGGVGGIQLEDHMSDETVIDLGDGVTITRTQRSPNHPAVMSAPPGPAPTDGNGAVTAGLVPEPAVVAAPPPDTEPDPNDPNEPAENAALEDRVAALEDQVGQLQDVVGQLIDAMSAPMAAAAEWPVEEPSPKA